MKWIMLANSNDCRIYEYDHHKKHLALVDEISHPENKLKVHDWVSDHPGHYQSRGNHGSYELERSPVEISVDDFAREIAARLNKGRTEHDFEDITMLVPAKMEGLLDKHLNKETKHCIASVIQKNLMFMSEHELKQYLDKVFTKPRKMH